MHDRNQIPDYLNVKATNLDDGWSRFSPQEPLPAGSSFYVNRKDNPLNGLTQNLIRKHGAAPKYFFAGHRGCGKSTELNRLVEKPEIKERYWPVKFSVQDVCDFNDLEVVDILLAIGGQIFTQHTESGGKIKQDLLDELEGWKGRTIELLTGKGAVFEGGAGFDIGKFFINALLKVKTERFTREIMRQEIGPRLSELINIINLISAEVQIQRGRPVLVIVEDMDKPALDVTRTLIKNSFANLVQPVCAIVYTIHMALYFEHSYANIREQSYFLPNVKLHAKKKPKEKDDDGVKMMREFVTNRMDGNLIEKQALDDAIAASGGVLREIAHIMQKSIDRATVHGNSKIRPEDVAWAVAQIRSSYRRLLNEDDYQLLREVRKTNEMCQPKKLAGLMYIMAAMEYSNGENWCDVHPAIIPLLNDRQES